MSEANDFALLDGLGGDVAGALQLLPVDRPPPSATYVAQMVPMTDSAVVDILKTLPNRPLLAGEEGLRLSLAGAQSKVPVVLVGRAVALPARGQPTTHILKLPIATLTTTTENEAAVMRLARAVGLDVASVEAMVVNDYPFLLIERYDRIVDAGGLIRRLHQEDFCQALGVPPNQKYASEGGPVFRDCFALLRRVSTQPARDVLKLLDAVIFNLIVGNADAHGKNFSILYAPTGPRLAPLYDLLATVVYSRFATNSAMKIGRAATLTDLDDTNWVRFAGDIGIGLPFIRRRAAGLCEHVRALAPSVCATTHKPGLDENALASLGAEIVKRAEILSLKGPKPTRPAHAKTRSTAAT